MFTRSTVDGACLPRSPELKRIQIPSPVRACVLSAVEIWVGTGDRFREVARALC